MKLTFYLAILLIVVLSIVLSTTLEFDKRMQQRIKQSRNKRKVTVANSFELSFLEYQKKKKKID